MLALCISLLLSSSLFFCPSYFPPVIRSSALHFSAFSTLRRSLVFRGCLEYAHLLVFQILLSPAWCCWRGVRGWKGGRAFSRRVHVRYGCLCGGKVGSKSASPWTCGLCFFLCEPLFIDSLRLHPWCTCSRPLTPYPHLLYFPLCIHPFHPSILYFSFGPSWAVLVGVEAAA